MSGIDLVSFRLSDILILFLVFIDIPGSFVEKSALNFVIHPPCKGRVRGG